jgi:hypothetical protein
MRQAMSQALDEAPSATPATGCAARRKESYYAAVADAPYVRSPRRDTARGVVALTA